MLLYCSYLQKWFLWCCSHYPCKCSSMQGFCDWGYMVQWRVTPHWHAALSQLYSAGPRALVFLHGCCTSNLSHHSECSGSHMFWTNLCVFSCTLGAIYPAAVMQTKNTTFWCHWGLKSSSLRDTKIIPFVYSVIYHWEMEQALVCCYWQC